MICFLAFLILFSTQPKCFLEVPLLRGKVAVLGCGCPLTLLDRFTKVVIRSLTPPVLAGPRSSPFVLVTEVGGIIDGRFGGHPVPHVSSRPSLFSQPSVIGEEVGDVFGLLTDVCALVLAILVNILKLLEGLDNVDIVAEIDDDVLRASVQAVIEKSKRLKQILHVSDRPEWRWQRYTHFKNVPPILPFVVQSLIQNLHNLDEVIPG